MEASSPKVMPAGVMPLIFAVDDDQAVGHRARCRRCIRSSRRRSSGSSRMEYSVTESTGAVSRLVAPSSLTVVIRGRSARLGSRSFVIRLAGAVGVQLVGRLGIQPGDSAAQAQPLRGDDAAVRRGKGLAQDAGVEACPPPRPSWRPGGRRACCTAGIASSFRIFSTWARSVTSVTSTLIDDGVKFIHDHMVQHLGEVLQPQALFAARRC